MENRKSFVQIQHCKRLYHFCYFSFISTFILGMQLRTSIKYQLIFYYPCISNCAFFYYICPFLFSCLSNPRKIKTTTRRFTFQNHLVNLIYKVHQLCRYLNGALQNKGKILLCDKYCFFFSSLGYLVDVFLVAFCEEIIRFQRSLVLFLWLHFILVLLIAVIP